MVLHREVLRRNMGPVGQELGHVLLDPLNYFRMAIGERGFPTSLRVPGTPIGLCPF